MVLRYVIWGGDKVSSRGWIKLHRKMLDNPIFQDPYLFKLWMYCLLKASHSKHKQLVGKEIVELSKGQFIWGRIEATNELNKGSKPSERKSESTWERYLKLLEELEMLNRETNSKCTIVTIVNWRVYQDYGEENERQSEQQSFQGDAPMDTETPPKSEQQMNKGKQRHDNTLVENKNNNEQQVNSKRTTSEQRVNTNKNVKNVKNGKKKDYTSKIKDLLPVFYAINNFNQLNKKYWDVIRETRKTGRIAKSVIYNTMKKWEKYDPVVIEYALKAHIDLHAGKREEYTIGIMRNTSKDEALDRMNVIPFKRKRAAGDIDWEEFDVSD